MLKTIFSIFILIISYSGFAQDSTGTKKPEKVYSIKLTESEVNALWNVLQFSKSALPTSDAAAKSVTQAIQTIGAIEAVVSKQYQAQNPKEQPKK